MDCLCVPVALAYPRTSHPRSRTCALHHLYQHRVGCYTKVGIGRCALSNNPTAPACSLHKRWESGAIAKVYTEPGPGAYNDLAAVHKTKPRGATHRIATRPKQVVRKSALTPGPGGYNIGSTLSKRGCSFGGGRPRNPRYARFKYPEPWGLKPRK